jgi:cytochrome P450
MPITIKDLPGPKGIPFLGNSLKLEVNNLHNQLEEWAAEYGQIYRLPLIVSDVVVITEPKIIQHILKDRPEDFIRMKKVDKILREGAVHGVFNAEGEEWKLHRKMVTKGLDVKHQKAFFDQMLITVERLYRKWKMDADEGRIIDIQQDFLRFTVDITTNFAFGYDMNSLEEKGGVVQDHMEKIFPMIFKRINDPIPWYKFFKNKDDKAYDNANKEINVYIDRFISDGRKRLEKNPELRENPSNFLEAILLEAENEEHFGDKEVKGNLMTVLLAGEDTTAHTLAWSIFLLTQFPESQSKIRSESDAILGEEKWVNEYEKVAIFREVEAVANETMRMCPVAPLLLFEPTSDVEIEGYAFKEGSLLLVQSRYAAMLEENFSDAKDFKPSRWLRESKCPVHNNESYIPFGGGPRFCPGKNLAILEIRLVLSMLLKNFDIEMITPHMDVKEIMAFTMMASDFKVKLTNRS